MTHFSRKSLIGTFALVASLSAPLAFAQSAEVSAEANPPTATAAQAETATQGADAAATASTTTASPGKKSWADVDADKNGKLTKAEAAVVPALGQVFDKADDNADGALTADEYKAYVAKVQGKAPAGGGNK